MATLVWRDAFDETGAGVLSLDVRRNHLSTPRLLAGGTVSTFVDEARSHATSQMVRPADIGLSLYSLVTGAFRGFDQDLWRADITRSKIFIRV